MSQPAQNDPQLTITTATVDDVPELTALVRRAYRGEHSRAGWTTEADLLDDQRIDEPEVERKVTSGTGFVLAARLSAPGTRISDGTNGTSSAIAACCEVAWRDGGRAYFGMFAVQPALQSAGIGRKMLTAAETEAQARWNARVMEMTVIAQRDELIAWYERRGYRRTGETRPFPYSELVDGKALRDDLYFTVLAKDLIQHAA